MTNEALIGNLAKKCNGIIAHSLLEKLNADVSYIERLQNEGIIKEIDHTDPFSHRYDENNCRTDIDAYLILVIQDDNSRDIDVEKAIVALRDKYEPMLARICEQEAMTRPNTSDNSAAFIYAETSLLNIHTMAKKFDIYSGNNFSSYINKFYGHNIREVYRKEVDPLGLAGRKYLNRFHSVARRKGYVADENGNYLGTMAKEDVIQILCNEMKDMNIQDGEYGYEKIMSLEGYSLTSLDAEEYEQAVEDSFISDPYESDGESFSEIVDGLGDLINEMKLNMSSQTALYTLLTYADTDDKPDNKRYKETARFVSQKTGEEMSSRQVIRLLRKVQETIVKERLTYDACADLLSGIKESMDSIGRIKEEMRHTA
ncbi:MAG: hypothetical protein K6B41_11370 [Butyrivibrio sp.]|nr:hypothetical protein [Butyrivibrio sp.]